MDSFSSYENFGLPNGLFNSAPLSSQAVPISTNATSTTTNNNNISSNYQNVVKPQATTSPLAINPPPSSTAQDELSPVPDSEPVSTPVVTASVCFIDCFFVVLFFAEQQPFFVSSFIRYQRVRIRNKFHLHCIEHLHRRLMHSNRTTNFHQPTMRRIIKELLPKRHQTQRPV